MLSVRECTASPLLGCHSRPLASSLKLSCSGSKLHRSLQCTHTPQRRHTNIIKYRAASSAVHAVDTSLVSQPLHALDVDKDLWQVRSITGLACHGSKLNNPSQGGLVGCPHRSVSDELKSKYLFNMLTRTWQECTCNYTVSMLIKVVHRRTMSSFPTTMLAANI